MRKWFLALAILLIAAIAVACAQPVAPVPAEQPAEPEEAPAEAAEPAAEEGGVNWRAYEGTQIRVILNQHPIADVVELLLPDFQETTGIDVNLEVFPEDQYREKVKVELLASNKNLDAFMTFLNQEGELFYEAGWYTDLQQFLDDPTLTAEDYGWPEDYPDASVAGSKINGVQVSIPIDRPLPPIVYYRKDLFQENGLPTPESLGDLEEAAKTIYEKTDGEVYGIVNRGKGAAATSQFRHVLHEFGGKWNDLETGRPTVNTPEAIAAFEWWGRTLREYGPPGPTAYHWYEARNEFLQGNVAISLEGAINAGVVEDPEESLVVGKVGYLPMLPGPGGGEEVRDYPPEQKLAGLAVSNLSEKKEAAWLFVQWMTNKEAGLQYLLTGKQSARKSAWRDERFLSTTNPEWAEAMQIAGEYNYATPCYAPCSITDVTQARDIIGEVIVSSILGEDVKAAADEAQEKLVALWEKEQAGE